MLLVINGGSGFLLLSFFSTFDTTYSAPFKSLRILSASSLFFISNFLSSFFASFALKLTSGFWLLTSAVTLQYSSGTKAFISLSLSQISLTATDCTLPALRPYLTFFQRRGLI